MIKDCVIASLGAALVMKVLPWHGLNTADDKLCVFLGIFIILIIFCLFCEELVEKWQKHRKRAQELRKIIKKLQSVGGSGRKA